jgi:hypothetical protein
MFLVTNRPVPGVAAEGRQGKCFVKTFGLPNRYFG